MQALGELQPLVHQLVFESKVQSVLHAGAITWLSRSFRLWQQLVQFEIQRELIAELLAVQVHLKYAVHNQSAEHSTISRMEVAQPLSARMIAFRELEAFRSAREELEGATMKKSHTITGLIDTSFSSTPQLTALSLQSQLQEEKRKVEVLRAQLKEQRAAEEEARLEAGVKSSANLSELSRLVEQLRWEAKDARQPTTVRESLHQQLEESMHEVAALRIELSEEQARAAKIMVSVGADSSRGSGAGARSCCVASMRVTDQLSNSYL